MAVEKIPIDLTTEAGRRDWLALRKLDVTTGDIAALLGVSKFQSPLGVWAIKNGLIGSDPETELMVGGRHLEKAALSWLREDQPTWDVRDASVYCRDVEERIGSTPDFVVHDPARPGIGMVDAKVPAMSTITDEWRDGDPDGPFKVPEAYRVQVNIQAAHTGATWGAIALLELGGFRRRLHVVPVAIDPQVYEAAIVVAREFWRRMAENDPPPASPELDDKLVKRLWSREKDGEPDLDLRSWNAGPAMLADRDKWQEQEAEAKKMIAGIDTAIKSRMKDAAAAIFADGRRVTWKTQRRKETIIPAGESRVFRVGKAPKKESALGN